MGRKFKFVEIGIHGEVSIEVEQVYFDENARVNDIDINTPIVEELQKYDSDDSGRRPSTAQFDFL